MKDIESELGDMGLSCDLWERYGFWTICISSLIKFHESFQDGIDLLISRIDMILDLDLELKISHSWIEEGGQGNAGLGTCRAARSWDETKNFINKERRELDRLSQTSSRKGPRFFEVTIGFKYSKKHIRDFNR